MDDGCAKRTDPGGQNDLAEEVRKASLESLDPVEKGLVVDHTRDHTEDSSSGIVVVVDVVGSWEVGMGADYEIDGLVMMAGQVGTRSMQK